MDIRFPILEEIEKNGNCIDFVTLLNKIDATPITTHGVLQVMIQEKLISGTLKANSNVTLKPAGFALLSQLRADADKEARQHAKNKRSKIHAISYIAFVFARHYRRTFRIGHRFFRSPGKLNPDNHADYWFVAFSSRFPFSSYICCIQDV